MTLGNHIETVGPGAGVIIPPNVTHSIANVRGGVMTIVEFTRSHARTSSLRAQR